MSPTMPRLFLVSPCAAARLARETELYARARREPCPPNPWHALEEFARAAGWAARSNDPAVMRRCGAEAAQVYRNRERTAFPAWGSPAPPHFHEVTQRYRALAWALLGAARVAARLDAFLARHLPEAICVGPLAGARVLARRVVDVVVDAGPGPCVFGVVTRSFRAPWKDFGAMAMVNMLVSGRVLEWVFWRAEGGELVPMEEAMEQLRAKESDEAAWHAWSRTVHTGYRVAGGPLRGGMISAPGG